MFYDECLPLVRNYVFDELAKKYNLFEPDIERYDYYDLKESITVYYKTCPIFILISASDEGIKIAIYSSLGRYATPHSERLVDLVAPNFGPLLPVLEADLTAVRQILDEKIEIENAHADGLVEENLRRMFAARRRNHPDE